MVRISNRVMIPAYLDESVKEKLDRLSKLTRVPVAVYVREAIDDLLEKYTEKPEFIWPRRLKPRKRR